jgi:predicted dehydrogenase
MPKFNIGLIGLDTSHAPAFTRLLNDETQEFHVAGAKVTHAFAGGSPDFPLSWDRVGGFTDDLRANHGVIIVDSPAEVAKQCDVVLITSADGRVHLDQFREVVPFRRPTFIDKPFANSYADAREIVRLAEENQIPLLSCSSLRFAVPFVELLEQIGKQNITATDFCGPMAMEPTQPGLFWYGIHVVEMLFTAMGRGCVSVTATTSEDHDFIVGKWNDGRIGTLRGNRLGNNTFGATLHTVSSTNYVNAYSHPKPGYASLLENLMSMLNSGKTPVDIEETLEIIRFIEAANQSRETGQTVMI